MLIWNTDETQLRSLEDHRRLACFKNTGQPLREGQIEDDHKTIVPFISAAGNSFIPTVIFKLKTVPPLHPQLYKKFDITGSENGWITGAILKTVIESRFVEHLDRFRNDNDLNDKWALLLLDNHSSRLALENNEWFAERKIKILPIPPHSSALLQPLDMGPNLVLKQQFSRWYEPESSDRAPERRNRQMEALSKAMSMATCESVICGAWKRTGLWPINFDAVTSSRMIKNEVPAIPAELLHKRGPLMTEGRVFVNGAIVQRSINKENEQPKKKAKNATGNNNKK